MCSLMYFELRWDRRGKALDHERLMSLLLGKLWFPGHGIREVGELE